MGLDNTIKVLYFGKTMEKLPPHGSFATCLAALQQKVAIRRPSVLLSAIAPDEGLALKLPPQAARPAGYALPDSGLGKAPILIGASKTQPVAVLEEAIRAGLVDFGENKVQEAQSKWPALKAVYPRVRLHLIGPLQSNKAEDAVALFEVIHTVDRMKIAEALAQACKKLDKTPAFLVQVNTGEEPQKAGVTPRDLSALLAHCRAIGLPITGLMCVPPENENPAPHFALLKKMADTLELRELSMGMSGDFETALRLGSTMVRVGTALFGARS